MQTAIDFTTSSPINVERIKGQNGRLYRYLSEGNTITCMSPAVRILRIGYLNSRISDLRNRHQLQIFDRTVEVEDSTGEKVHCKEYSISPFNQ